METPTLEFESVEEFSNHARTSLKQSNMLMLSHQFVKTLQNNIESGGVLPMCEKIRVSDECITMIWEDDRLYFSFKILDNLVMWVFADYDGEYCENGIIDLDVNEMLRIMNTILLSPTL